MKTHLAGAGAAASQQNAVPPLKCRLCDCRLSADEEGDDFEHRVCASCLSRPEARRLGLSLPAPAPRRARGPAPAHDGPAARGFTPAELSLVSRVHTYMPAQQLLDLLNERLRCDLGDDAAPYTMDMLRGVMGNFTPAAPSAGHDWGALRKILGQARKRGLLAKIDEQVINDFAVVYSLNARQVMGLKDILLDSQADLKE